MGRGPAITQADIDRVIQADVAAIGLLSDKELARVTGRSDKTIAKIKAHYEGVISAYRSIKQRDIIEDLDIVRRSYLARLADPQVVEACSGPQAGVVFGILTDKLLLESGRPTSITLGVQADISLPDVLGRLQRAISGRVTTTSSSGQGDNDSL